jgi:hypothetical protein
MARTKSANKEISAAKSNMEKLGQDEAYMEIPEMKDIPGQEHIHNAGVPGELADTTISSDDEEGVRDGKDLLADDGDEDLEIVMGTEADITKDDLALLGDRDQDMDMGEDELAGKAELDDTDNEGDLLNESGSDRSGKDLDVPEADEGDAEMDEMGEGDEENNYYSLGSDDKDDLDNGTPNEYRK